MSYRHEMANGKYYILVGEDQDRIKIGTILRKILNNYSIPCVLYITFIPNKITMYNLAQSSKVRKKIL